MLTKQQLIDMEPESRFATGTGTYPEICEREVRWVAVRGGGMYDWTIYYHEVHNDAEYVARYGVKLFTESIIQRLVPCEKEALQLYRL